MTVSIFQALATLPSGKSVEKLTPEMLGLYLRTYLGTAEENHRNDRHALRDIFYRDGGVAHMKTVIDQVFKNEHVRELRKQWVEHARFNNALKRIVNELSTVYAEPAARAVDDDVNNVKYQLLLDAVQMDEQMLQVSRLLNLHRALLVGFRIRQGADGTREPSLEIATPANVRVVMHPNDAKQVVGWLIRTDFRPVEKGHDTPSWVLWTDHERVFLRADFSPLMDSYSEHGIGICPWVPVTLGPSCAGFWPGEEGEDLVSAHKAIWLVNVMMLKETKSATKVMHLTGDTTSSARGQAMDSENVVETQDGTSISTIDSSMDLGLFRDTADHILTSAGNNYGMPAAILTHQGTQSAEARDLLRIPLKELRKQQQIPLRRFERRLALVMSVVLRSDTRFTASALTGPADDNLVAMAFEMTGWRIDFGEATTPLGAKDALDLFIAQRAAGVSNTVDYLRQLNPDLTETQARAYVQECIGVELWRNAEMRPLMQMSGSMAQSAANAANAPRLEAGDTAEPVQALAQDSATSVQKHGASPGSTVLGPPSCGCDCCAHTALSGTDPCACDCCTHPAC